MYFLCLHGFAIAQVGIGTNAPELSAQLEVRSTSKGFLPPRMTASQRDAISNNPPVGLMVFCTNCGLGEMQYYNRGEWKKMDGTAASPPLSVGVSALGGKIAYILQPGDPGYDPNVLHGFVATVSDISTGTAWGCFGVTLAGADGSALGTGNQNTIDIMAGCSTAGIAARICGDLVEGGFSDWYLPSKDELNKLYINRVAIGGFSNANYWTSTEAPLYYAYIQDFTDGTQTLYGDRRGGSPVSRVRAIRAF